jgi:hypothetical protein
LQTTLHQWPRNSLEQLGQIKDTSFFFAEGTRFVAARFAAERFSAPNLRSRPTGVSTGRSGSDAWDDFPINFRGELGDEAMNRVVAQIRLQKILCAPQAIAMRDSDRFEMIVVQTLPRQTMHARSTVKQPGAVPKW